jgi:hypothetical protein
MADAYPDPYPVEDNLRLSPMKIPKLLIHFTVKGRLQYPIGPENGSPTEDRKTVSGATMEEEQRGDGTGQ